jgi:hypothetical protein
MAFMLGSFTVPDYDTWKQLFESDKLGRGQAAKAYTLYRGVEDPNQVIEALEFGSVAEAQEFRERLLASGLLAGRTIHLPPTVVEVAETGAYTVP